MSKNETIKRCGSCRLFARPPDRGKWGWCMLRKIQRTKDQKLCKSYERK